MRSRILALCAFAFAVVAGAAPSRAAVVTPPPHAFTWNGSRVAVQVGDSKTARGVSSSGSTSLIASVGYPHFLNGLLGQRLSSPITNNAAVGGTTSTDWRSTYATAVVPLKPGWVFIELGTNDVTVAPADPPNQIAKETTVANLLAFIRTNQQLGAYTVLSKVSTRSGWGSLDAGQTITARKRLNWINNYIGRVLSKEPGVFVVDPNKYWVDPASATGNPLSGYTEDGLHDTPIGAYYRALAATDVISNLVPTRAPAFVNPSDSYDATDNPTGNMLGNGILSATAGTVGTGVSGTVATQWTVDRFAGSSTGAVTAQTRTDGVPGYEQVLAFSAASGAAREAFEMKQSVSTGYAVGDQLEATCGMDVTASNHITQLSLVLEDLVSSTVQFTAGDGSFVADTEYYPTVAQTLILHTPPLTVLAGNTSVRVRVIDFFNGSVGAETHTLKVRGCSLRHVSVP